MFPRSANPVLLVYGAGLPLDNRDWENTVSILEFCNDSWPAEILRTDILVGELVRKADSLRLVLH